MPFLGTLMCAHTVTGLLTHHVQPSAQPHGHRGHSRSPVDTSAPAPSAGSWAPAQGLGQTRGFQAGRARHHLGVKGLVGAEAAQSLLWLLILLEGTGASSASWTEGEHSLSLQPAWKFSVLKYRYLPQRWQERPWEGKKCPLTPRNLSLTNLPCLTILPLPTSFWGSLS